ncbi:autotransporter outer membrane beta-barrel domain-containing protein [Rhizobium sp. C4]|uniref:autotransporter outer membrane beta-barrel domain-containing protein n=1 Tax=Rhizobium sp. C4 TaxID=1349800 RepID=UPI001E4ED23B|nr:autotransporter domain-containing protein [Rhizobium sp. C4]MCD2172300.1 autotransporter domain-containing protein [Rhizobium sp. C4]
MTIITRPTSKLSRSSMLLPLLLASTTALTTPAFAGDFWDGSSGTKNNGQVEGGSGTWTVANSGQQGANWTNADGTNNASFTNGTTAVFKGASGTVTVDNTAGQVQVSGLQFASDGYAITGGAIELLSGKNSISVDDGVNGAATAATIGSNLTGQGGIDKTGLGTLILTGTNTNLGDTTISAGTLQVSGSLGSKDSGLTAAGGDLKVVAGGSVTLGNGVIGNADGASTATVSGSNAELNSGSELTIGRAGTGSLTVESGGHFVAKRLALSTGSWEPGTGGSGTLVVTGPGTLWENTGGVDIARTAGSTGSLTVSGGATAHIVNTGVYTDQGAQITFTGAGTTVEIGNPADPNSPTDPAWLSLGGGTVTISDSASVYTSGTYVGASGSALSTVTVDGAGSSLAAEVRIYVGGQNGSRDVDPINGSGSLTISGGATAWGGSVGVGMDPHSQGTVLVTGTGSELWAKANTALSVPTVGNFYVGFNGTAQVVASAGGRVKADNEVRIGYAEMGDGELAIGAASTQAAAAAGVIDTPAIVFGDGTGKLVFNHTDAAYTLSSNISGAGGIVQMGSGTTILTGDSSNFTGGTTVAAGGLKVNGSLSGSVVTVQSGGTLSGTGTVGGVVAQAGAILAPGNSPGTLAVAGNFHQAAGSIYMAEVVPGSTISDLIVVNGQATLAKGAVISISKYGSGSFTLDSRYTLITATGEVMGTYTVVGDTAVSTFYSLGASYDPNRAYLEAQQTRSFANAAITPDQIAVAGGLQSLPSDNGLRRAIGYLQTDAEAQAAFNGLSGEIHSSIKGAMVEDSRFVRNAANDRLRASFNAVGAPAVPTATYGVDGATFWSNGYGAWSNVDSNGNAAGMSHHGGGFVAGADAAVFDTTRLGLLAGYARSTYSVIDRGSSATSDNYTVGAYSGSQFGNLGLRLGSAYTWSNVDTSRGVGFAGFSDALSGHYNAGIFQAFGEVGYRIDVGSVSFEPFTGLAHVSVQTDAFSERGGLAALTATRGNTDVTFTTLGLRGSTDLAIGEQMVSATGTVAWRHAVGNTTPTTSFNFAGSNPFGIAGTPGAKDSALVDLGLSTKLNSALSLGVSYTGQFGDGTRSQGVRANFNVKF